MNKSGYNEPSDDKYAEHLRAIMEQEALIREADARPPEPSSPFLARVPVVAIVALLFSTVVLHNVRAWTPDPVAQAEELERQAGPVAVLAAAQRVEAFRQERGRLPGSLEETGLAGDALLYVVAGEEFMIRPAEGPVEAVYDSEQGADALMRVIAETSNAGSPGGV